MAVTGYRAEDDSCFTMLQKEKQRVRLGRGPWLNADSRAAVNCDRAPSLGRLAPYHSRSRRVPARRCRSATAVPVTCRGP